MIWFTSDSHFGHSAIRIHQAARSAAFECIEEMDTCLIENINRVVGRKDALYHLGDFVWQASRAGCYRQRLNVHELHVVRGNHDAASLRNHVSSLELMLFKKFKVAGMQYKIHLSHYPLLSWQAMQHGGLHLYGHSHSSYEEQLDEWFPGRRAMDVGVDNIYKLTSEWRPISLEEIIGRLT